MILPSRENRLAELFPEQTQIGQWVALVGVVALALGFRLFYFQSDVMPILDGGMFHEFIAAIAENDMRLPPSAVYNHTELPFAYPPLAFWVGAALHQYLGLDIVQVLRVYPFAVHLIYVVMIIPFLRGFGFPMTGALLAFAVMILIYQSFEWLIMGGGLTRATGAAFAISAGTACAWAMRRDSLALAVLAGVLAGLGMLTHLLWGILGIMFCVAACLSLGDRWGHRLRVLAIGVVIVLAMTVPWFLWVIGHHGMEPFQNAQSGSMRGTHQFYRTARAQLFPSFLTYFCIIGAWECFRRRVFVWPLLIIAIIAIIPRNYFNVSVVPNAVLATVGAAAVWQWLTEAVGDIKWRGFTPSWVFVISDWRRFWVPMVLCAGWTFFGSFSDINPRIMSSLSDENLDAFEWVNENLEEGANILVIAPEEWFSDEVSEWMPVLTEAKSLTTIQSTEWLPDDYFPRHIGKVGHLKRSLGCPQFVDRIAEDWPEAQYVYATLHVHCHLEDPRLIQLYETDEVWIFQIDLYYGAD
ncbi:hypothetical protein AIOL_002305 [Candidatus Rhodobacter oscarellae]|uniref:Glycosyltransferase RgtA/B/C/D-like domain-containing protein n=1 Tax=Candidatus Rhodobacter oscarellae TaxID=1675527 RepID=A0A0J9E3Q6_9RHOB|nr:hypothetical protein [Candidatus Rhodobacter lobularis]KMW57342.1 hypothetical protein AIOL_002305 [Candidatus Rhodobacter lobularis]